MVSYCAIVPCQMPRPRSGPGTNWVWEPRKTGGNPAQPRYGVDFESEPDTGPRSWMRPPFEGGGAAWWSVRALQSGGPGSFLRKGGRSLHRPLEIIIQRGGSFCAYI